MGRPPAPWLDRAYQLLADGQWHSRDDVVAVMVKVVPPGVARRRGAATTGRAGLSDAELIRRGARHIAAGSLNESKYIERQRVAGGEIMRLAATVRIEPVAHCPTCTCNER